MREIKHKRALPVYIAAAVFALYALIFPLYSLLHFLVAALITAAAWLLADKLIKPVTEYEADDSPASASVVSEEPRAFTDSEAMDVDTEVTVMKRRLESEGIGPENEIDRLMKTAVEEKTAQSPEAPAAETKQAEFSAAEDAMLRSAREQK